MKKDIFNFRRFGKYFMSDIRTCTANYGLTLVTLSCLILLATYVLTVAMGLLFGGEWDGPGIGERAFVFLVAVVTSIIAMPSKCYGNITEKQYGSQWLMIPVSKTEKFISMIIMACIIVPVIACALFFSLDALICTLDPTCGNSVISWGIHWGENIVTSITNFQADMGSIGHEGISRLLSQLGNPWLYIDDAFGVVLPFLLGALVFKKGKIVKTFLSIAAVGMLASFITSPLMMSWTKDLMEIEAAGGTLDYENFSSIFDSWFFRNIALVDTISDTIVNVALLTAIYFRIKTLKH